MKRAVRRKGTRNKNPSETVTNYLQNEMLLFYFLQVESGDKIPKPTHVVQHRHKECRWIDPQVITCPS